MFGPWNSDDGILRMMKRLHCGQQFHVNQRYERCSRQLEGRKREKAAAMSTSRLMTDARNGTEPGLQTRYFFG